MENNIDLTQKTKVRIRKSYVGQKFNMLTVIEELGGGKILCRCDCGNEKVFDKYNVTGGNTKSCGCLRKIKNDYIGKKFNNLTIIKELENNKVLCHCDCGNEKILNKYDVTSGNIKSCGCLKNQIIDYTGKKFNHLTIVKELGGGKILCKCDCGNEVIKRKQQVIKGLIKSCGCITRNEIKRDLTGQRFGMLVVLKRADEEYNSFICKCDCGNEIKVTRGHLINGSVKSCGCLKSTNMKKTQRNAFFGGTAIYAIKNGKANKNSSTGVKGVCFLPAQNKYMAYLSIKKKNINLGYYDTLEEAKQARLRAEKKYFLPIIRKYFAHKKTQVRKSYVGQKFGKLTILEELGGNKVLCRCDCGNVKILKKSTVINGGTKSCGCLLTGGKVKSYVGKKFNHLTIIEEDGGYRTKAICRCDCGNIVEVKKKDVILGAKKYCGDKSCPYKTKRSTSKKNIIGEKFNSLLVLEEFSTRNSKGQRIKKLRCQCDCGNVIEIIKSNVINGHTKSCGCLNKNKHMINRTGQKFGMLTILKELGNNKILCQCDCGSTKEYTKSLVVKGNTKSCGCTRIESIRKAKKVKRL